MRSLFFVATLIFSGTASAISVDFEDSTTNNLGAFVESQGFTFVTSSGQISLLTQWAYYGTAVGWCGYCGGNSFTLTMSATDGSAFGFSSFEIDEVFYGGDTSVSVTGNLAGGGSINTVFDIPETYYGSNTIAFDSSWSNLESVVFTIAEPKDSFFVVDNFVVTAVPIPAAAWLFGSALAGLGWLRRKQTA